MKRAFLVSKTHLDLGFTDFAANVVERYLQDFIPNAIDTTAKLNTDTKHYAWMTGSWILKRALECGNLDLRNKLTESLKRGDIVTHALPFTTHTELLDADTMRYGLDIVKELDEISGVKTIAAKMTDVPGHSIALVPLLAEYGIKLLHIGVNDASHMPDVPSTFLWKYNEYEVVVIYEQGYGKTYVNSLIDDILIFAHTNDNQGPLTVSAAKNLYRTACEDFPEYEIVPTGLNELAEELWEIRSKLPIVTAEIGDSWIHGATTDPMKAGAMRELIALKNKWLVDGTLIRGSDEYRTIAESILLTAEHTNGMDSKRYLADYSHYLKHDFEAARKKDIVTGGSIGLLATLCARLQSKSKRIVRSYSTMEKSWKEQRAYIEDAVSALPEKHRTEAEARISALTETPLFELSDTPVDFDTTYELNELKVTFNKHGSVSLLSIGQDVVMNTDEERVLMDYASIGYKAYDYWHRHYNVNLKQNRTWAYADFGRPKLSRYSSSFPVGRFAYSVVASSVETSNDSLTFTFDLTPPKACCQVLGAPRNARVKYVLTAHGLTCELVWTGKDANRLTEQIMLHFYPSVDMGTTRYFKLGNRINPMNVVTNGNRACSAVEHVTMMCGETRLTIKNRHCPLVCMGAGKILRFDNIYDSVPDDGLTFILYNNVWGTNFPLWYEDNAYFKTEFAF